MNNSTPFQSYTIPATGSLMDGTYQPARTVWSDITGHVYVPASGSLMNNTYLGPRDLTPNMLGGSITVEMNNGPGSTFFKTIQPNKF